jgi:hypothetical protein
LLHPAEADQPTLKEEGQMAAAFDSTSHHENLFVVLRHALWLAELAGEEQDAVRREVLIHECMA